MRALIEVHGAPRWIIDGVSFGAGAEPVALGELVLDPVTPLAFATDFLCGDMRVSFGVLGDEAILRAEDRDIPMRQVKAASGARYEGVSDPDTSFWNKGDEVTVQLDGRDMPECREILPPAERPYRARGNEPGWHVSFAAGAAEITVDYGVTRARCRARTRRQCRGPMNSTCPRPVRICGSKSGCAMTT